VVEFIRALDAGPVHLVGQSYGAYIAICVALRSPERLRSVVLQEPSIQSLVTGPNAAAIHEERQRDFAPAAAAAKEGRFDVAARLLIEALINKGPGTWAAIPEYLQKMFMENTRTLPLFFSAPPPQPITCSQLGELKLPTLIINGAQTLRFFSYVGWRVAECVPGSRRAVIANASHGVETQNPTAYREILLDFLHRYSESAIR
jgi:pimeloyl-ACP methyl ester carboxylesterase